MLCVSVGRQDTAASTSRGCKRYVSYDRQHADDRQHDECIYVCMFVCLYSMYICMYDTVHNKWVEQIDRC
jgi:hypothetical protein